MRKYFLFISGILALPFNYAAWAMGGDGDRVVHVRLIPRPSHLAPAGLELSPEDKTRLFKKLYTKISGNPEPEEPSPDPALSLKGKSVGEWHRPLKTYCQIEPHRWGWLERLRYGISLVSGLVISPPQFAIHYVGLH